MSRKGAFNLSMSVKTFLIILFVGLGFLVQQNSQDKIFGIFVLAALAFFAYLAWSN